MKLTALIALGVVACAMLWAETMNVKLGEWESTSTVQLAGMPPIPQEVLDKMTPQQRQMMEERMKGNSSPHTTTSKGCLTKEDLDKGFNVGNDDKACKRTIISSTSSKQEFKIECNRENGSQQTGTVKIEASSPESAKGSMQMTMTGGGRSMTSNATFSSKWLGPTCEKEK